MGKLKKIKVQVYGYKNVRAYNMDHAKSIVQENVNLDKVNIPTFFEYLVKNAKYNFLNISTGIITLGLFIGIIRLANQISLIENDSIRLIGVCVWGVLCIQSLPLINRTISIFDDIFG